LVNICVGGRKQLWWDLELNVPMFVKPVNRRCKEHFICGDVWCASTAERRLLATLVSSCFSYHLRVLESRLWLFHRVPAPKGEYAVEVLGEGLRLGVIEYDNGWHLYPSGALASLIAGFGCPIIKVKQRGRLKGKKVCFDASNTHYTLYVIVASNSYVGPARVIEGISSSLCVKVRDMAPMGFRLLRQSSIRDVAEFNSAYLKQVEIEAISFLRRWVKRFPVYVAVSGGIDSGASLVLAVEAFGPYRVRAVYVDTGMEFKASKDYVIKLSDMLGVDIDFVEVDQDLDSLIRRYGLPSRNDRWCTRKLKLEPLREFYTKRGVKLVVEGVRAYESIARARSSRVAYNPLLPGIKRLFPIHRWTRLEVQTYMVWKNMPINELYDKGFTRIGCVICPAMHLFELYNSYLVERCKFIELVKTFADALGSSYDEVVKTILDGKWRFRAKRLSKDLEREERDS